MNLIQSRILIKQNPSPMRWILFYFIGSSPFANENLIDFFG